MKKGDRFKIQDRLIEQWEGTHDNNAVFYALECARECGNRQTVQAQWRWLADDLTELWQTNPNEATACYCWISGWIKRASKVLADALKSILK